METPSATPTPKTLTRTGIMLAVLPALMGALNSIPEVKAVLGVPAVPETSGTLRRTFRAIVTIGVRMMLDAGVPMMPILMECKVAIENEVMERQAKAKQDGATQAPPTLPS
jgi:hypothetical protein